jgi:membrane-bound metal-dependent hydrolase YbcI (DUF457 family)
MMWRSHVVIGGALAIAVFYLLGTRDIIQLSFLGGFGALSALVPDLDHDSSKGRKVLDSVVIVFALVAAYLGGCGGTACVPQAGQIIPLAILSLAIVGLYFVLFRLFKPRHRGITHTLFANAVFGIALYLLIGSAVAIAGTAGYFSHLVADRHVRIV